jgi:hypothetical protein
MRKENNKLIDKVIASLDWDSIYEVNKCFKHGVGDGISAIPGLKRKSFSDGITKLDIKNELKSLLKYVIDNDLNELIYGYWMIFWTNAQWSEEYLNQLKEQMDDDEGDDMDNIILDSTLEVIYSPQRICAIENSLLKDSKSEESDEIKLEMMLRKALEKEQYELASKIRDVIKLQNNNE